VSDVSVQATVSFIITFRKGTSLHRYISSVADKLGSFPCRTASQLAVIGAFALPRIPAVDARYLYAGRSRCYCVGLEGWARTNDSAVNSR
jgi:hypothetical protein